MNTPGSPDITSFLVAVEWDLSNNSPQINLKNLSQGPNLAGVDYGFIIKSPSQTVIYAFPANTPTISGVWDTWTFYSQAPDPTLSPAPTDYTVAPWPRPFNQIEWSGAPYSIQLFARDSVGNNYDYTVEQSICRPAGNVSNSQSPYGVAKSTINIDCNSAQAYFENITNTSYQGESGTQESSILKILYPNDQTDVSPQPFIVTNFSTALVPITYDSDNYEYVLNMIYNYEFANESSVTIRYYGKARFQVRCNIDLCPLFCDVQRLIDKVEAGNCANLQEENEKLLLINAKLNLVLMAKFQPLCTADIPAMIEEIKAIGGFNCDCCTPSGIQPFNSANLGAYNFAIQTGCGDITGYPVINGNNITFVLSDKTYIFKMCTDVPTTAFTVTPSTQGCTRTYCLNVNMATLANDILATIQNNVDLVNLFNSIVNTGGSGAGNLIVDGRCIFNTAASCNFTWDFTSIPAGPSNAILTSVLVNGVAHVLNFAFNTGNLPALVTYLNGQGLGTFTTADLGAGEVLITSNANTANLGTMSYVIASVSNLAKFTSDCTGFVPLTANQVVQSIINYLCAIDDSEMVTSQAYEICYIDPNSLQKVIVTVTAGTPVNEMISTLLDRNCDTVDYIIGLGRVDCASIKAVFPATAQVMQLTDYFLGTKATQCAQINPVEAGIRMMQMGIYNAEYVAAFCALVQACNGGFICAPYTVFQLLVQDGSPADTIDIIVTFTHPAAIKNTIRYARVDNTSTPVYTTITDVLPGDSPYTISGVDDGQYIVTITPIYADGRTCGEVVLNTGFPTSGINAFSASFDGTDITIDYNAPDALPQVKVTINYPNGGTFSQIYDNDGMDITITPPAGVYGDYTIYMTPVYNENTGYFGQNTAPAIVTVTPPNNSTFVNNTTNVLAPISMVVTTSDSQVIIPFNVPSVAASGGVINFYLPPTQIATAVITFGTGTVGTAYFSIPAVYLGTVSSNQILFEGIDTIILNGVTITVIDPSP